MAGLDAAEPGSPVGDDKRIRARTGREETGVGNAGTGNTEVSAIPSRESLAEVLRSVAEDAVGSDPGQLLSEAVAGGLLITEGVVGCSVTELASVTKTDADRYRTPVYAGQAAIALDHVQYAAGRGPCLTAIRDGQPRLTEDPAELSRSLPGWREQAARHGVGSVLSLPLAGTRPPAGLNFYGTAPGVFRPAVVSARARLVSRAVTAVLTRSNSPAQQAAFEGAAAELRAAAGARALLAQARAAIAGTGDVTDTEAFTRLAQRSAREGRSIVDVARDVLASTGRLAGQEPPS
jgi:hypothetical protein